MRNKYFDLSVGTTIKKVGLALAVFVITFGVLSSIRNVGGTYAVDGSTAIIIFNDAGYDYEQICLNNLCTNYNDDEKINGVKYASSETINTLPQYKGKLYNMRFNGWSKSETSCDEGRIYAGDSIKVAKGETLELWACFAELYQVTIKPSGGKWSDGTTDDKTISYEEKLYFRDLELTKDVFTINSGTVSDGRTLNSYIDNAENGKTVTINWIEIGGDDGSSDTGNDSSEKKCYYCVNNGETIWTSERPANNSNGCTGSSDPYGNAWSQIVSVTTENACLTFSNNDNNNNPPSDNEDENQTYKGVFSLNGGTLNGSTSDITVNMTSDGYLKTPGAPEKEGFRFVQWKIGILGFDANYYIPNFSAMASNGNVVKFTAYYVDESSSNEDNNNNDNNSNDPSDNNESNVNPNTGSWMLYIVYLVGILSLGYTGYYSYKVIKSRNN